MGSIVAKDRRHGRPTLLPELFDWLEGGFPGLPAFAGLRGVPAHQQGIRIEEQLSDDAYQLSAELPGVDPDKDVEISVTGDVLTLRAERSERYEGKYRSEFRYGALQRSVALPAGADTSAATADYRDGILTVRVPVSGPKDGARTIRVTRGKR